LILSRQNSQKSELVNTDTNAKTEINIVLTNFDNHRPLVSPLKIEGKAVGNWFFEAVFPVRLVDALGQELARGQAYATSDWTTSEMVPFTASLEFKIPATPTGFLILSKDNPSGLSQNDESLKLPIIFNLDLMRAQGQKACRISGCSGQICSEEERPSTCEFSPEYDCYKTAGCERQPDGRCGWTMTPKLNQCIINARKSNSL